MTAAVEDPFPHARTPSEWLLAVYDLGRLRHDCTARPMFDLIEDDASTAQYHWSPFFGRPPAI